MANPEHLEILKQGVEAWNRWRATNPDVQIDLRSAYLKREQLVGVNFSRARLYAVDFTKANLTNAVLAEADISEADLSLAVLEKADLERANLKRAFLGETNLTSANLSGVNLDRAELPFAKLIRANLTDAYLIGADFPRAKLAEALLAGANLTNANFSNADLSGANLTKAIFRSTVLGGTNLSGAIGLETCIHTHPSIIDIHTVALSDALPLSFLRGCGLPDILIEYLPALLNVPIQFYSCFISYSSKDQGFAERLHADLQAEGVRVWFAPHDLPIGARIRPAIDESIRVHDKLLLVLSEDSVISQWVEQEVETALSREREQDGRTVLFPIRIDDAVMEVKSGWPALLRNTRNVGDFTRWKDHDSYSKAFERLLRDLKAGRELRPLTPCSSVV